MMKLHSLTLTLLFAALAAVVPARPQDKCTWNCVVEDTLNAFSTKVNKLKEIISVGGCDGSEAECAGTVEAHFVESPNNLLSITTTATTTQSFPPTTTAKSPVGGRNVYRAVGYYAGWDIYARNFTPQQIPASRLTHLLYAFADIYPNGTVFLPDTFGSIRKHYASDSWSESGNNVYGNLKQLGLLKQTNRNLKVMLSIGGWTYSNVRKHFDPVGASKPAIRNFAASCVAMVRDFGFDGIDIDWEYPQNRTQGQQFLALLTETRKALDGYAEQLVTNRGTAEEARPSFWLSIAAPAADYHYKVFPMKAIAQVVNFVNVMAYGYAGPWSEITGHTSNLAPSRSNPSSTPHNTISIIQYYVRSGVPSEKLNLGMALYGRKFSNTAGLGKPCSVDSSGDIEGDIDGSFLPGIYDFKDLPLAGTTEYLDKEASATYSYDNSTKTLISYDTVKMALTKVKYIKQKSLGGAMWWEISSDKTEKGSIITNMFNEMSGLDGKGIESKPNWIYWPDSAYDNVRNGFKA